MKEIKKRISSFVLALAMVLTLMPMNTAKVYAASWQFKTVQGTDYMYDTSVTTKSHNDMVDYDYVDCNKNDGGKLYWTGDGRLVDFSSCEHIKLAHEHDYTDATWDSDGTQHWHECVKTDCPDKTGSKTDVGSHSGGTATCLAKAVCVTCGVSYGDFAAHNYGYSATGNVLTAACQNSGCTESVSLTLTANNANYSGIHVSVCTDGTDNDAVIKYNLLDWTTANAGAVSVKFIGREGTTYESETAPTEVGKYTVKAYPTSEGTTPTHVATANFEINAIEGAYFQPTELVKLVNYIEMTNNHDGTIKFIELPVFVGNTMNGKTVKPTDLSWNYETAFADSKYLIYAGGDTYLNPNAENNGSAYNGAMPLPNNTNIDVKSVPYYDDSTPRLAVVALTNSITGYDNDPCYYGGQIFTLPTKVTYDLNGGTAGTDFVSEDWVIPGEEWLTTNNVVNHNIVPTKTGYIFEGWYTAETDGDKVETTTQADTTATSPTSGSGCRSVTLYAHWKKDVKPTNEESGFTVSGSSTSQAFTIKKTVVSTLHITGINLSDLHNYVSGTTYTGDSIYVTCDGEELTLGTDYTVTEGSVKINFSKTFLDTLPVGSHTLKTYIKEGVAVTIANYDYLFETNVTIKSKPSTGGGSTTPTTTPTYKVPNTSVGQDINPMNKTIGLLSIALVAGCIARKKKED